VSSYTPVDYDPFAQPKGSPKLTAMPERFDPFAQPKGSPKLTAMPDRFDPFKQAAPTPRRQRVPADQLASNAVGDLKSLFPGIRITSGHRGPGGAGFASDYHHTSHAAVDATELPGMTFGQFKAKIRAAGYPIVEAIDEYKHPNKYTTGGHWHVVLGKRRGGRKLTVMPAGFDPFKAPRNVRAASRGSRGPAPANHIRRPANRPPQPQKELGLGEALWEGVKNIPKSAKETAVGMYEAVRHPIDTIEGAADIASGAGSSAVNAVSRKLTGRDFDTGPKVKAQEARFHAVADPWLKHPYATLKERIAEDPVGTALAVAPVAGSARLVGKLGVRGVSAARLAGMTDAERAALRAERAAHVAQLTRAKNVFRTVLSRHDLDAQRAARELEDHQRVVGNAPVEHQRDIIKAVESASSGGIQRLQAKYRPAARAIRNVAWRARARISEVLSASGKDGPKFIEDYYAHLWKQKPSEVRAALSHQGSGRNLKARKIPTYEEGLEAGLTPVHENPLSGMAAYSQNMSRFLATHDLQNKLRSEGLARWVPKHRVPEGWQKLDGINTEREAEGLSKPINGLDVHTGDKPAQVLAAPKVVANLWNRHVDRGLRAMVEEKFGERAGKFVAGAEKASHVLGSTKLAFSAFHPLLIAGKGVASDMGNALRHFTRGAPADVVKSLAHMPFAPVATAVEGFRMGRRMLSGDEAMSHLDKLYRDAGGRIGPADVYRSTLSPSFLHSAMRGTFTRDAKDAFAKVADKGAPALHRFKATLDLGGRVMESWNDVVFRHYVPMMKRGAFERELATSLKAHPEWDHAQQLAEARRVLSSIDGRMGEISRDNLFWSRTAHQLGRMLLLSPSWQVGDVRVLEHAAGELPESLRGLLKGKGISQGPAQAAGLVGSFMLANALGNYIYTGQPPKSWADLKAFRTGGINGNDGSPERAQVPSIMKDFFGIMRHPQQEVVNKLHPALKTALEVYENRDWRNLPIVRPADARPDGSSRVEDALRYVKESLLPIPFADNPNGPNSHLGALSRLAGLRPMGSEYTNPERYEATQQWLAEKAWEDKKRADRKAAARKAVRTP
jgi:hypothetical protein